MRTEAHFLWDIIEAADALDRFLEGKTEADFREEEILRSAVHAKLIIIGEAVSNLSDTLTERYTEIPWQKIRGFRNAVIHGYFKIDWDIVWNAARRDSELLRSVATRMLAQEFPQFRPENL